MVPTLVGCIDALMVRPKISLESLNTYTDGRAHNDVIHDLSSILRLMVALEFKSCTLGIINQLSHLSIFPAHSYKV